MNTQKVFSASVKCPSCGRERIINTTDVILLKNPPKCFACFMSGNLVKDSKNELGK